jgi:DNA invertase Pin-like site-specific DNA recombinase
MSVPLAPRVRVPTIDKIQPRHRERQAYIYIRQSSFRQVVQNRAGQENQYALTEHARALGWPPERIQVIDADLGHSGRERDRPGFQALVAAVSLGHVGIVLASEASRLARNNADWYELVDLAALVGTLIADTDGIYDPREYNDRLLLGLRGMLSEAEVHLLHQRLDAGRLRQVEQGTFRQHLPTGLVRLPSGEVVKDPDQQIQHTLALVFDRFQRLGSAHKVVRSLQVDGMRLPRRQTGGWRAGELVWQLPSGSMVQTILHNPAYAGAFAYGRRGPAATSRPGRRREVHRPVAEWTVIHQDVYPAYITWETYMANQDRLANNRSRFAQQAQGAPRHGAALLAGVVVCGQCGCRMRVRYRPTVRYVCAAREESHRVARCFSVLGASLEQAVVTAFFEAIQPAELALLEAGLTAMQAEQAQRAQHHADQVKRAEYAAHLAQRQYLAIDPDNRLVAAELERRWEQALRTLAEAREAADRLATQPAAPALDPLLIEQLRDLSQHLPTLWHSGRVTPEQQKELLRSLIRRVVVTRPGAETVDAGIVWVSDAVTRITVQPRLNCSARLHDYDRIVARVTTLCAAGYQDRAIARQLQAEGYHSAHHTPLPVSLVRAIRQATGVPSLTEHLRGQTHYEGAWTAGGLARHLGVGRNWIYNRILSGLIPAEHHPITGHYLIPDDAELVARLRAILDPNSLS